VKNNINVILLGFDSW